jgi:hydrogenase maturation protease
MQTEARPTEARPTDYLIVGDGNTLRGDDGVGWRLAGRLQAALAAHGAVVQLRLVQQLLPELAAEVAEIAPAVLVIADCAAQASGAALQKLCDDRQAPAHSHGLTPAQLLAMTVRLYEFGGSAWLATIPGSAFAHGEELSRPAQHALDAALPSMAAQLLAAHPPAPLVAPDTN